MLLCLETNVCASHTSSPPVRLCQVHSHRSLPPYLHNFRARAPVHCSRTPLIAPDTMADAGSAPEAPVVNGGKVEEGAPAKAAEELTRCVPGSFARPQRHPPRPARTTVWCACGCEYLYCGLALLGQPSRSGGVTCKLLLGVAQSAGPDSTASVRRPALPTLQQGLLLRLLLALWHP